MSTTLEELVKNNEVYENRELASILGATHVSGRYYFTQKDFLNEGADELEKLGMKSIKLWLNKSPQTNYVYNSDWPIAGNVNSAIDSNYPDNWNLMEEYKNATFNSLIDMLKISYYQDVLSRDRSFTTYVFEATEFKGYNWKDGFTQEEIASVKKEFRDLTIYLMTSQKGTGRTFILQNWEGDNALNIQDMNYDNGTIALNGMINWSNARQDGITEGRNYVLAQDPNNDVKVYGALEMNQVNDYNSTNEQFKYRTVVDDVVPYTHMDLYSFSSWGSRLPGDEQSLLGKLDHIADKAPDSEAFGDKNVMLGEFGAYQITYDKASSNYNQFVSDAQMGQYMANRKQVEYALEWGVQYMFYWELYCNGYVDGVACNAESKYCTYRNDGTGQLVATNEALKGVWLIDAEGNITPTYYYFYNLLHPTYISDEFENTSLLHSYSSNIKFEESYSYTSYDNNFVVNKSNKVESLIYQVNGRIVDFSLKVFYQDDLTNEIKFLVSKDGENFEEVNTKFISADFDEYGTMAGYYVLDDVVNEGYVYLKVEVAPNTADYLFLGGINVFGSSEIERQNGFDSIVINDNNVITPSSNEAKSINIRFDRLNNLSLGLYVDKNLTNNEVLEYLEVVVTDSKDIEYLACDVVNRVEYQDYDYVIIEVESKINLVSTYFEIKFGANSKDKIYLDYYQALNPAMMMLEIYAISQEDTFEKLAQGPIWYKPITIDKVSGIGENISKFTIDKEFGFLLTNPYIKVEKTEGTGYVSYVLTYKAYSKTIKFSNK